MVCIAIPSCVDIENGVCSYPILWIFRMVFIAIPFNVDKGMFFYIFHMFIVFSYNRFTYIQQVGII
jgi:hypothetical protein